jgi:cytochrome oxidase assembly protein ShyY1
MLRLRPRPKFSLIPTLACVAMIALTISLGNWQSRRALEKDVIEARHEQTREAAELAVGRDLVAAEAVDGRRVLLRGSFEPSLTVYWDNQIVNHVAGFAVLVPFRLAGSDVRVLVDRGLVRAGADRANPPVVPAPPGEIELHGRAYLAPKRTLELKEGVDTGKVWQNVSPEKFAQAHKLILQPFIVRETGAAPAPLLRMTDNTGLPSDTGMTAAKHRGYAFQWYSLAALAALLFLLFTFLTNEKGS